MRNWPDLREWIHRHGFVVFLLFVLLFAALFFLLTLSDVIPGGS